jgi:hypothetical protein
MTAMFTRTRLYVRLYVHCLVRTEMCLLCGTNCIFKENFYASALECQTASEFCYLGLSIYLSHDPVIRQKYSTNRLDRKIPPEDREKLKSDTGLRKLHADNPNYPDCCTPLLTMYQWQPSDDAFPSWYINLPVPKFTWRNVPCRDVSVIIIRHQNTQHTMRSGSQSSGNSWWWE